jgi:hypothetical protein
VRVKVNYLLTRVQLRSIEAMAWTPPIFKCDIRPLPAGNYPR